MRRIPEGRAVGLGGREVELTPKENELLALLTSSPGEVFSRARILSRVWGLHEDPLTNVVDVYIRRLRKKLGQSGAAIRTVRGAGYSFQTDPGETPHD